ncbi:MAG: glycosyltransferase family 4 protein [Verrucomicrobia bacterium]|nr:glycosyltransferase family 4 protein [Verrucomicrobiota bacterium]
MKFLFLSGHAHLALDPAAQHASGGAELQVALLAKELVQRGEEVVILAADIGQGDAFTQQKVTIRNGGRFDTGRKWDTLKSMPRIFSILRQEKPDVVVVYGWTSWLYLLAQIRNWLGYRLLFVCALDSEIDGGFRKTHPWRGKFFQKGMKLCDVRLAITEHQAALFREQGMSCNVMRLLIQENFSPERVVGREKKSIDLLWVARCNQVKQPQFFLDLATQIPEARCRMICSNQDQALWNSIKKRAATMKNVEFLGKVPYHEIQSHFDQAKIFVNTSLDEGVPNTFIHAGLGSTAIVSLKVDPDQMFQYFQTGCCVHDNFQLLVEKTGVLLANREKLFLAQREANRFVCEWHNNKKNVETFLKSLQT